jgi:hypothetical protein
MSYVRGLVPDHPSLERLSYKRPESADAFYSVSSDFEKIAAKQKARTLSTAARFGPTGYEKVQQQQQPLQPLDRLFPMRFFVYFLVAGAGLAWSWAVHPPRHHARQPPPVVGGQRQGPLSCPLLQPRRVASLFCADRRRRLLLLLQGSV